MTTHRLAFLFALIGCCGPCAAGPANASLDGTLLFNARLRYEAGDASNLKDGNALTLGTRLGYLSPSWDGFQAEVEGGNTAVLSPRDDYSAGGTNSGGTGRVNFPDAPVTYVNQAWVDYAIDDFTAKVGRQRLVLDNARFVGDVGWWQKMQTYDAATATAKPTADLSLLYGYVWHVNRIYGNLAPQPDWRSRSHFLNASDKAWAYGTVTAYAYLLDFANSPANSSNTYGGSVAGAVPVGGGFKVSYRGEFARQQSAGNNPRAYAADYGHGSLGLTRGLWELSGDYEVMGSDGGRKGFATPLATLHVFDGWVNQFLATPAAGLRDAFGTLGVPLPAATPLKIVYHRFRSDVGGLDFGHEWDALITHKFGRHWTALAEAARYRRGAAPGYFDTNKYWLQTEFSY